MISPTLFASTLVQTFRSEVAKTASTAVGEIVLFRALQRALTATATVPGVAVDEFHGSRHQVWFQPSSGGNQRRCELCDLMVMAYTDAPSFEGRLTFLQAKYERRVLVPKGNAPHSMTANLVQLDLLSSRPTISGWGSFEPPAGLLQAALLPSIGSFGFFSRVAGGGYELTYASADAISLPSRAPRKGRLAKVGVPSRTQQRRTGGLVELESADGLSAFGKGLASLQVGTPVDITAATGRLVLRWLRSALLEARREQPLGDAANRLVEIADEHTTEEDATSRGRESQRMNAPGSSPDLCVV